MQLIKMTKQPKKKHMNQNLKISKASQSINMHYD